MYNLHEKRIEVNGGKLPILEMIGELFCMWLHQSENYEQNTITLSTEGEITNDDDSENEFFDAESDFSTNFLSVNVKSLNKRKIQHKKGKAPSIPTEKLNENLT